MVTKVQASHILTKTEQEAFTVLYELEHGASFESMAAKHSLCPSKKSGGDLGWFGRGQMVKEFEVAAFSLVKGTLSKPVKTQFGWHIIKVVDAK